MKITTITYKRTVNMGNYENKSLEATTQVEEDEDPSEASDLLRSWVINELTKARPGNGS